MRKIEKITQIAIMVVGVVWTLLACHDVVNSETGGFAMMFAFGGFIWLMDSYEQNKNK